MNSTHAATRKGFLYDNTKECVKVYADGAMAYMGLENQESVKHSVAEYVREQAYTNGMESFWAMMKRGNHGTYHYMSRRHPDRYVTEFASRHNQHPFGAVDHMERVAPDMEGKRLRYTDLIAEPEKYHSPINDLPF